ncbi:MAG: hypothetical protein ACXWLH_00995 [Candidatus Saccharimonadales bacterium]
MNNAPDGTHDAEPDPADKWLKALMDPRMVVPPTTAEIVQQLMRTGDCLTPDWSKLKDHLDKIAPVRGSFEITDIPNGHAPEEIRRQWIGVTLPIRGFYEPQEGVAVLAREALEILKANKPEAHEWWQKHYTQEASLDLPNVNPEELPKYVANIGFLTFDAACGIARLLTDTPLASEPRPIAES